jgi:hypothetical protein
MIGSRKSKIYKTISFGGGLRTPNDKVNDFLVKDCNK